MFSKFSRIAVLGLAVAVTAATLAAGTAFAAPGGKGGKGTTGTATLIASPSPAAAWGTRIYLNGCGYKNDTAVWIHIIHATYTETFAVPMYGTGCMATTYFVTREPGAYTIEAWQYNSPKVSLQASTSLPVQ